MAASLGIATSEGGGPLGPQALRSTKPASKKSNNAYLREVTFFMRKVLRLFRYILSHEDIKKIFNYPLFFIGLLCYKPQ